MSISVAYDATHLNLVAAEKAVPIGSQFAGYVTGSADVLWTPADRVRHPGFVQIDQDHLASDFTADILDVENGAATPENAPEWYIKTHANYLSGTRPGQRSPGIYMSAGTVGDVATHLQAAGIHSGPVLFVANWNLSQPEAVLEVQTASGPFPVIGVQFKNNGIYDIDVFSGTWLSTVSRKDPVPAIPPGQWDDPHAWTWQTAFEGGIGLDGKLHLFEYDNLRNVWTKIVG